MKSDFVDDIISTFLFLKGQKFLNYLETFRLPSSFSAVEGDDGAAYTTQQNESAKRKECVLFVYGKWPRHDDARNQESS